MARTKPKNRITRIDAAELKQAANGRWREILVAAGAPLELLDGQHHPCPKCGGSDRFRFTDQAGDGSVLCNQCGRDIGDGLESLRWLRDCALPEAIEFAAGVLGLCAGTNGHARDGHATANGAATKTPAADPAQHLVFKETWNQRSVELFFCRAKKGVTATALLAFGGRQAVYRGKYQVIALPIRTAAAVVCGWCIWELSGGTLPAFHRGNKKPTQEKMLVTHGSQPGIIAPDDFFNYEKHEGHEKAYLMKVEGPTDALALWAAMADNPQRAAIFTNSNGAKQNPAADWMPLVAGRDLAIIHDADQPGEEGAAKWVKACVPLPNTTVRHVKLPYPVEPTRGKDLRDWLNEGHTAADLAELVAATPPIAADALPPAVVIESEEDPHRLARLFLTGQPGPIVFWRKDYYRFDGRCYRPLADECLEGEVTAAVKAEFDRLNLIEQEDGATDEGGRPKQCRHVTGAKTGNVIKAVNSLTGVGREVEPPRWE